MSTSSEADASNSTSSSAEPANNKSSKPPRSGTRSSNSDSSSIMNIRQRSSCPDFAQEIMRSTDTDLVSTIHYHTVQIKQSTRSRHSDNINVATASTIKSKTMMSFHSCKTSRPREASSKRNSISKKHTVSKFQEHKEGKPSSPAPERIDGNDRGRNGCHSSLKKKSDPPQSDTHCSGNPSMSHRRSQLSSSFSSRSVKSADVSQNKSQQNQYAANQKAKSNNNAMVCSNAASNSNSNYYQVSNTLLDPTHCIPFISTSQAFIILTKLPLNSPLFVKRTSREWTYAKLVGRHHQDMENGETTVSLEVILECHGTFQLLKLLEEKNWKKCLMLVNENAIASSSPAASRAGDATVMTASFQGSSHGSGSTSSHPPFHRRNTAPEPRQRRTAAMTKSMSFHIGTTFSTSHNNNDACDSSGVIGACNSLGKPHCPPSIATNSVANEHDMCRTLRRVESLDSISSKDGAANHSASSTNQEMSTKGIDTRKPNRRHSRLKAMATTGGSNNNRSFIVPSKSHHSSISESLIKSYKSILSNQ